MTTATQEKPQGKPRKYLAKLGCRFGNVNLGDERATLGFSTERANLTIDAADQCFCGTRVNARLVVGTGDPDQKEFWVDKQWDVQGIADCKSYRVSRKRIASAFAFAMSGVDVEVLSHFAKQEGFIYILKAETVNEEEGEEEADEEPEEEPEDDSDAE